MLTGGLKWAHRMFPAFKRARMVGGDPAKNEVYGYVGWSDKLGYVALHNPADREAFFTFKLDRKLGLAKAALDHGATYGIWSPLTGNADGLPKQVKAGSSLTLKCAPKSVRVLEFPSP